MLIEKLLNWILNPFGFYAERVTEQQEDQQAEDDAFADLLAGGGDLTELSDERKSLYVREATTRYASDVKTVRHS